MNIKKVSELSGVSADTIRYYERIGLIPPVKRNDNGIRNFDEEDLRWIVFSRQMRNAGLSIESLVEYLTLFQVGNETVPARKEIIADQIGELKEKASELNTAIERLEFKLANYDEHMIPAENALRDFNMNK
ncbi:transcriptional regulator [Enterococcus plantarum]|uniref:MerR family transcriptional regulator n=1 Tax=Enterococcus plantarum TaxID=1077675 RepID=A0A2W3Z9X5_9ENTE|nr:MerR family transcriptional regulator [Enterococcus plantarum]MBO0468316.1 MerR family transcriptional regulator [Enterococcus plantarum]OEG12595.1 transcriptional regulator [Enterococcus plantarum]PZL76648.1 MerR family transcriptional regulator [Enterococcus plantarum]